MDIKNGIINIQAAGYNGARTVCKMKLANLRLLSTFVMFALKNPITITILCLLSDNQKAEKTPSPSSIHTNSSGGAAPSSLTSMTNSVKVVHMSVRKTQSDPPDQLPSSRPSSRSMLSSEPPKLLPRNPTTSVVVIEHTTKMAVNNNVGEENQKQLQDEKPSSSSSNEKQIHSHIFV